MISSKNLVQQINSIGSASLNASNAVVLEKEKEKKNMDLIHVNSN